MWWLTRDATAAQALSDRIEWSVYTVLSTSRDVTLASLTKVIYTLFPGSLTPDPGLIELCLQSYGELHDDGLWTLRTDDTLAKRIAEQTELLYLLILLGHRFGLRVWLTRSEYRRRVGQRDLGHLLSPAERGADPTILLGTEDERAGLADILWHDGQRASHVFEVEWTAMVSEAITRRGPQAASPARFLVLPSERLGLLQAKRARLPLLDYYWRQDGWDIIKFDVLRTFAHNPDVTLADFPSIVGVEPPVEQHGIQLHLF